MSCDLTMELPTWDFMITPYCLERVPVWIEGYNMPAKLYALKLRDYDVILVMD